MNEVYFMPWPSRKIYSYKQSKINTVVIAGASLGRSADLPITFWVWEIGVIRTEL